MAMGRNGENWGARLKLTRYEEHWQAQAMAMAMAGAGARFKLRGEMGKHIMTWEIITGAGFKLRGTLVIGENWGAKLKLRGEIWELTEH